MVAGGGLFVGVLEIVGFEDFATLLDDVEFVDVEVL